MKQSRILILILTLLIPVMELVLVSSHLPLLVSLRLIYLVGLVYLMNNRSKTALAFVITGTAMIEIFSFQSVIGISAIAFIGGVAVTELVARFWSFLSQENVLLKALVAFITAMIFRHLLFVVNDYNSYQLAFWSLAVNLLLFTVTAYFYQRMKSPANAFKK